MDAQSGFMNQLQGQPGLDRGSGLSGPGAEQIPSAQAQMLRDQQPDANLIARDFVGQQLANGPFQAFGIGRFGALFAPSALSLSDGGRDLRIKEIEFFFGGRNRQ